MKEQLLIMFAVIGGAAIVPLIAGRFRIPSAALEILYGVLLFNTLLQTRPEWFILLKELGLIYLMFIVGMELDLRTFVREKNFKWYIAIPLLSFTVTPLIFHQLGYPFFLGVAVAMISAGIIIPVLKESGIMQTDMGRDVLGTGLTGELLSILVLMGIDIYHRYGFTMRAGLESVKVVLLFALAAFFLRLLYIIAWWNPIKVEKVMESEDPVEIGIRVVMLIALAGSLVAFTSGLEPILGSFMAGLVFSYVFKSKGRFEDKINAVGFGFFTPFFFIGVGADLDINLLKTPLSIQLSLILVVAVFLSNIFPVMFSRFMGLRNLEGLGMSFLLSAPLSLMVVAGTLGVKMGLIDEALRDTLILTAVLSSIIFPSLFRVTTKKLYQREEETVEPEGTKG
jgi:Kef-type K+ transport system membrane component KefB